MNGVVLTTLRLTRRFDAPPERVFDAWTSLAVVARWLFTTRGSESHTTELDVRVGGAWKIVDRRDGVDYAALGEYRVIDRPRRLVFSFGMPQFSPEFVDVTVDFAPDGDGCLMSLSQERVQPDHVQPTTDGWNEMFDVLAGVLATAHGQGN
jgi:uncharacterized protein YndB with AHSA1/START domain